MPLQVHPKYTQGNDEYQLRVLARIQQERKSDGSNTTLMKSGVHLKPPRVVHQRSPAQDLGGLSEGNGLLYDDGGTQGTIYGSGEGKRERSEDEIFNQGCQWSGIKVHVHRGGCVYKWDNATRWPWH